MPKSGFDIVWVGSVFTHLPEDSAKDLMARLLASLKPRGVLAITTHGRCRIERMKSYNWGAERRSRPNFNLTRDEMSEILSMYQDSGYGYVGYPNAENYGLCVAEPAWYSRVALAHPGFTQILFQEKADNAQDLSAFMREDVGLFTPGPFWKNLPNVLSSTPVQSTG